MEFFPKVSIIIPVYNGANYLREAIDSALAQTYNSVEILVVNDGSCDDGRTRNIALSYGDKIRYFEKENGGVATALNMGIEKMTGDYFSWLSHDDAYYPDKIKTQIEFLERQTDKNIILYSDFDVMDKDSKVFGEEKFSDCPPEKFLYELIRNSFVNGCTVLVPQICFDRVGVFRSQFRTTQDYDLWVRMAQQFPFVHLSQKLIRSRQHANQGTQKRSDICQKEINDFYVSFLDVLDSRSIPQIYNISPSAFYFKLFQNYKKRKFKRAAHAAFLKSLGFANTEGYWTSLKFQFLKIFFSL